VHQLVKELYADKFPYNLLPTKSATQPTSIYTLITHQYKRVYCKNKNSFKLKCLVVHYGVSWKGVKL